MKKHIALAALPPVLVNALIIPLVIMYAYGVNGAEYGISLPPLVYLFFFLTVAAGQSLAVYGLGLPLYKGVRTYLFNEK